MRASRMYSFMMLESLLKKEGIINTEWGAFSNGLPLTEFDKDMDSESINPGEQIFEKTISGMYLGEIVRRVLLKMAEVSALFGESVPDKLYTPYVLRTPNLCAMQQDESNDLKVVGKTLSDIVGVTRSSLGARKTVLDVCDTIVKRGGRLAGAGIVGILQKMEQDTEGLIFGKRTSCNGWWVVRALSSVQRLSQSNHYRAARVGVLEECSNRAHKRWLWHWSCSIGCYKFKVCN